jgi:hypothetical protein
LLRGGVEECWFVNHPRDNRQENKKVQDWKMRVFPERGGRWLHSERIRKSGAARQHFDFGEERWHDCEILSASDARQSFGELDGAGSVKINLPKASGM